jgi:hypothetical protein
MKKVFVISLFTLSSSLFTFCRAQSTSPRFGTVPNDDNTGRTLTYYYYTPTDNTGPDTAKFTPRGFETFIEPTDSIKDSLVIDAYLTRCDVCDKIEFQCTGKNLITSKGHVTFSTGFKGPNVRIPVTSKSSSHITFIFDGNAWRQVAYTTGN